MGETSLTPANVIISAIRSVFTFFDRAFYWILGLIYQLFFNVASADIFSNDTVMKFYGRIQLIIGVFVMFQLAMTVLKGIMNPDSFTDNKSGASNLITRIITSLILLSLLVPINVGIQPSNSYEKQIGNNGLLFGTLFSLQERILKNNTLGRLVLGTSGNDSNYVYSSDDDLAKSSRIFTSTVLKGFMRINLLEEKDRPKHEDGKDDSVFNDNRVCQDIDDDVLDVYTRIDADPGEMFDVINATCKLDDGVLGSKLFGTELYVFTYMPVISTIVAAIFAFILLSFTVDVAVRAVKLAVLRLIAPIPIINYMDPKGSKDGAFSSWTKALTSTYLDLFIRLAVVYFVLFLIQDMILNGVVMSNYTGVIGILSMILIWIGLFIFAKDAPKFVKQVLGIKDNGNGTGLFSGFGAALGLAGVGLGAIGAARVGWRAAAEENTGIDAERVAAGKNPHSNFYNRGRQILSTIGGFGGGIVTGATALGKKDANISSVLSAQSQANAKRAAHSTAIGRIDDSIYGMFNGRSHSAVDQAKLDASKAASSSMKDYKKIAVEEALKKGTFGTISSKVDPTGKFKNVKFNYEQLKASMNAKDLKGNFDYVDVDGVKHTYNVSDFNSNVFSSIEDSQTYNYLASEWAAGGGTEFKNGKLQTAWRTANHDLTEAGISYEGSYLGANDYGHIGQTIGEANANVADMSTRMSHIMHRANNQNKK